MNAPRASANSSASIHAVRSRLPRRVHLAVPLVVLVLAGAGSASAMADETRVRGTLAGVRIPFVENQGHVDAEVAYYAPTFAGTLFVTRQGELVYALAAGPSTPARGTPRPAPAPGWSLTETLQGGTARPAGQGPSAGGVGYFAGSDPSRWRPHLPGFEHVSLGDVWPGVRVTLRARGHTIEKVFTVAPGASVDRIRIHVSGTSGLSVDAGGRLIARTGRGDVTFTAPLAYQERDGVRRDVAVAYRAHANEYGFVMGPYDPALPLLIDPLLQSTFLGGSAFDYAQALAIHPSTGDVYVAGFATSTDFPGVAGGPQPATGSPSFGSAFVARLNGALTSLIQATYLGGSLFCQTKFCRQPGDAAQALAIHPTTGEVYVAGRTLSTTFPGTAGGAQPSHGGGNSDAFVARLNSGLTALLQATYLGGSDFEEATALAIRPFVGDIYVSGRTRSPDFPGTAGAAQSMSGGGGDGFVARLNPALTSLSRATYLGGSGEDSADALALSLTANAVFVAGRTTSVDFPGTAGGAQSTNGGGAQDAFAARLNTSLTALAQSTYLGGSGSDSAGALAIHPLTNDVYVAGSAASTDFPGTLGGAQPAHGGGLENGFAARLTSALTTLLQATYLGGSAADVAMALATHPSTGDVYVAGVASSTDFPGTAGGVQPTKPKPEHLFGGFVARLASTLTALVQATYLGSSTGSEFVSALAIHPTSGEVYVAGGASSTDFPGTEGGAQPTPAGANAFVARLTSNLAIGPDLTLVKTRAGNFVRGQVGATYTVLVSNVGTVATRGTVTVVDTLAPGLTATALGGAGWSCILATLVCTRTDPLASGSSYPPIALAVTVAADASGSFTNTAVVSGGGDLDLRNNTAFDRVVVGTFTDVGGHHPFFVWIEALAAAGITGGCASSPPSYCPDLDVTRGQMAVYLLRIIHGADYSPPAPTGLFADVPPGHPLAAWIEQLAREGITGGCSASPPRYCPDVAVTRAQMAVFVLRALHGPGFSPPPATGLFSDVPVTDPFAAWIEELAREGITAGCSTSPPRYCPDATATRGQTALFLVRAAALPLPSILPVVAYVTSSGSHHVAVLDTSNHSVLATVAVGRSPGAVAVNPDGTRVYVANGNDSSVSVIDTATNTVVATIAVGEAPLGIAVHPAGTRVYVASSVLAGTVSVIDTSTDTVVATVAVGVAPRGVAVNPAGTRVYVANSGFSRSVSVIDTSTNTVVATVGIETDLGPESVIVNPSGTLVYVGTTLSNTISIIETSSHTVTDTLSVVSPSSLAVHPDGSHLYVANGFGTTVTVIETAGHTVVTTIPLGSTPAGVAVHPAGTRLYVTKPFDETVAVIDTATNAVVDTIPIATGPTGVAVSSIHP